MRIDIDKIINDTIYLGYSAMASVGAGIATREIIDGNYLSGLIGGVATSFPLVLCSSTLKNVRDFRENRERSGELRTLSSVIEIYPGLLDGPEIDEI